MGLMGFHAGDEITKIYKQKKQIEDIPITCFTIDHKQSVNSFFKCAKYMVPY
jgi:hypothetical protein